MIKRVVARSCRRSTRPVRSTDGVLWSAVRARRVNRRATAGLFLLPPSILLTRVRGAQPCLFCTLPAVLAPRRLGLGLALGLAGWFDFRRIVKVRRVVPASTSPASGVQRGVACIRASTAVRGAFAVVSFVFGAPKGSGATARSRGPFRRWTRSIGYLAIFDWLGIIVGAGITVVEPIRPFALARVSLDLGRVDEAIANRPFWRTSIRLIVSNILWQREGFDMKRVSNSEGGASIALAYAVEGVVAYLYIEVVDMSWGSHQP